MTSLLAAAALAAATQAPAPPPAATLAEPRTITVTVVDDKGAPVRTLTPADVGVQENGVSRELTRLELDTRPLTLAVLVDTSESMGSSYRLHVVDEVVAFLLRLPEGSKYAIWTTGDRPAKVFDYGDNRSAAARAMKRVFPQGGNTLLDALVEAGRDLREQEGSRTAIVVVTGTGIGFTNHDRRQVVSELESHPAQVLAVSVEAGRSPPSLGSGSGDTVTAADYDYVLGSLAKSSGGLRESLLSPMGIDSALRAAAAHLGGQYRLTYQSTPGLKNPKVEVAVALPGVKVRVRPARP